jgi:hypothetical protein
LPAESRARIAVLSLHCRPRPARPDKDTRNAEQRPVRGHPPFCNARSDRPQIGTVPAPVGAEQRLVLPNGLPDDANPFRVIDWMLFTAYVAARHLTEARLARVEQLGRKMRTETPRGVLMLHWEDDVDKRPVENELHPRLAGWWDAHKRARNLCAGHCIPFAEYDPLLKAAWEKLNDIWAVIRGVASDTEEYHDDNLSSRLHELAASTTPVIRSEPAAVRDSQPASCPPLTQQAEQERLGEAIKPSEGEVERSVAADIIVPALLSASDIATRIQRNPKSVTSFLTRYAVKHPDCRVENTTKRQNEPSYLYRTADVWPALEKWVKDDAGE